MPITYTNRKGVTYHLCRVVTKTGKPRYYFAREPKGEPVDEIPTGFQISESVNGVVSLEKIRPAQILPEEVTAVEAAVRRHPKARRYRVGVKHNQIVVHEMIGPDAAGLIAGLRSDGVLRSDDLIAGLTEQWQARQDHYAQFTPVLRFILADADQRSFRAERWCYLGSIDDRIDIGGWGRLDQLASQMAPRLGTDRFFELI
jgi:hypothetical protein